jgi:hypothetical protein
MLPSRSFHSQHSYFTDLVAADIRRMQNSVFGSCDRKRLRGPRSASIQPRNFRNLRLMGTDPVPSCTFKSVK